ncbi:hypothetical protein GX48_01193 [Paracoccidioides brasiliensis]|nr:hypothetical protein GX48_01193 [Paracoccidioides brasiliensis]
MAYPHRGPPPRQYNDQPPPSQYYGRPGRGRGGYGPGTWNPGYDDSGQYYDERGGYGGGPGGRGQYDHWPPPPNRGRGGPPPNRGGYGDRRPVNGPPPGPGPLPTNFDKSFPRPPPIEQRPRQPNDGALLSPVKLSFDNPFPAFPRVRRGNSKELDRRMGDLDLNDSSMRPSPEKRPHTSNSTRQPPQRQLDMPQWGGPGPRTLPSLPDSMPLPGPKRSMTMPTNPVPTSPQYPGQPTWQEPPLPRPTTASGTKPDTAPVQNNRAGSIDTNRDLPDDFLDEYFAPNDQTDSDTPNFSVMPGTQDDNIVPFDKPGVDESSTSNSGKGYTAYRPPGGPTPIPNIPMDPPTNQFENAGFHFDLPPLSNKYDQGQPNEYDPSTNGGYPHHPKSRGMPPGPAYHGGGGGSGRGGYDPRPPPNQYGPPGRSTPMSYPDNHTEYQNAPPSNHRAGVTLADPPHQNPDALPKHPVPFRPGLENTAKPPPIRQYDNPPAQVQSQTGLGAPPQLLNDGAGPMPITHEELHRIQQAAKSNPSDHKAQLFLAKKLVEASIYLIDENGRADIKTRNKNRERYIFDAHKIVKKLVSAGYPQAMFYLADCYGEGQLGLEVDPKEAFLLYQSAAKAGHPESAYRLAVCCEMGYEGGGGTKRDPMKAVQWYRRAAALGDTPAMYKMGMILLKGLLGQQKNPREAVSWLKRAAERADESNPHALHELALLYENPNGNDAIIQDEAYSRELLEQAAKLGYKYSQYRLGAAYEHGLLGCPVDPRQSILWYTQAAAQGEHQGELALSGWYLTGAEGILQQSDTEAYLWARKAALAGLAKAEYAMGYFTEVGIGVPANLEDAKRWYWKASSQNFMKARERLEDLKRGGAKMQKTKVSRSAVNSQKDGDCIVM